MVTWVKQDDQLHRNAKQLSMSDAAYRLWTLSWSYCADTPEPTGFLSEVEAQTFARAHGKSKKVIDEVVLREGWDRVSDGYIVHDFEKHVSKSSTERVREWRAKKQKGNMTEPVATPFRNTDETVSSPLPRGRVNPVPDPGPVEGLENKESKSTLENENDLSPEGDLALSTDPSSDPVNVVFERWKQSTHKNGKTVLTAGRRRIIRAACKDYPLADVIDAVEGWEFIPHNRGENDRHREFNDIELLLRDAKHIETFRDAKRGSVVTTGKVHHLDAWAVELLGEGDRG